MAQGKRRRRALIIAGYAVFTVAALVAAFFLTFPYRALEDRIRLEAQRAGLYVRMDRLGPGLLSVRATGVEVSRKADTDPPPRPVHIDRVSVGPSLFPPGARVEAALLGGTVTVTVSGLSTTRLSVDLDGVDLSQGNLPEATGVELAGVLDGAVRLAIPRTAAAPGAPAQPDLSQASGTVSVTGQGLAVNGGQLSVVIPQFGADPTPLDLPRILLGDLEGKVTIDKGAATVDQLSSRSADLEAQVSGTVKLAKRLEYSEPALEVRFKPDPEFQKRLGILGSALSVVGADPKDPSWRMGRLTGYLGRPSFR